MIPATGDDHCCRQRSQTLFSEGSRDVIVGLTVTDPAGVVRSKAGAMTEVVVEGQRLPGIGWRYDIPVQDGRRLLLVVEDRGPRHIMLVDPRIEDQLTSARISEAQATAFAALLTGARFNVRTAGAREEAYDVVPDTEKVLVELVDVHESSPVRGLPPDQAADVLGTGVALLGVISDETPDVVETDPTRRLRDGDRLVVAARPGSLARLRQGI